MEMAKSRTLAVEKPCDPEEELTLDEAEIDEDEDALVVLVWDGDVEEVVDELSRTSNMNKSTTAYVCELAVGSSAPGGRLTLIVCCWFIVLRVRFQTTFPTPDMVGLPSGVGSPEGSCIFTVKDWFPSMV